MLAWKAEYARSSMAQPFMLSQQFPCSAGGRLLEAGFLEKLHDADAWDSFRLAIGAGQLVKRRPCVCCGGNMAGHAHILAVCPSLTRMRGVFLAEIDPIFASQLAAAPSGDWPSVLLSPHLDIDRLKIVVSFCAAIIEVLKTCENNIFQ